MKYTLFILILVSNIFGLNITKTKDKVIDNTNNLMWQDHKINTKFTFTHEDANKYCDELVFGGYSDWRLPTMDEYKYIIDPSRDDEIMLNKKFQHIKKDDYWTKDRTWLRNFGKYGYYLRIKSGTFYYQNRTYKKYVRCVRDN